MSRTALLLVTLALLLSGCGATSDGPIDQATASDTATATRTGTAATTATTTATSTPPDVPPAAPTGMPFSLEATGCQEVLLITSMPLAQAQRFVPANYTIVGAGTGQASGFIALKECADVQLDGTSIGPASTGDVGVFVDKGDPETFHYYQAWWTTDNAALWAALDALAWKGGLSNDTLVPPGDLGTGLAVADVAYGNATYHIEANVASVATPAANHAVGWFDTPAGTMTIDKTLSSSNLGSGEGRLTGTGDAAALFGPSAAGPALWNEYGMTGRVDYT